MGSPEKVFAAHLGEGPTGQYLGNIADRIAAAGPMGFQVGAVLRGIGLYLEHKLTLDELSALLIRAGVTLSRFDGQAEKVSPADADPMAGG